jgi:hypothetical protein
MMLLRRAGCRSKRHAGSPAGRYAAIQLPNTGWPGARSSGGCGLARPVAPGGVSLLAVLVSIRSSVVTNAASIADYHRNGEKYDGGTVAIPLVTHEGASTLM